MAGLPNRIAGAVFMALFMVFSLASIAQARVIELFPGDDFEVAAENLTPGDELILHAGTYTHTRRIVIDVQGTAQQPVVIRGADGEPRPVIRLGVFGHNVIDIVGASYLTLRGLEIVDSNSVGDGVNLSGNPAYITLEDLKIHDVAVGVNLRSSMHHIVVRRTEIFDTGDTGEGMYIGCHKGDCSVSESVFENNWIHDTLNATQGDGIEVKRGSWGNIVRNNVIHDTHYPCLILYGTDGNGARNLVEGNVVWNCGDTGIQVAADTIIRNNIIISGNDAGLTAQSHVGISPANMDIVHNTFVGGSPCLRINGWNGAPNMVFANNAVYCANDDFQLGGLSGVSVSGNVFEPAPPSFPSSGYITGRSEAQDFVDVGNLNVYPTADSPLLGQADPAYAASVDFNGTARGSSPDAGAYEWSGTSNPGWAVAAGFKGVAAVPGVTLNADPAVVVSGNSTTLHWTSTGADSCVASGGWSGSRALNGSMQSGVLSADTRFTLTCSNASGSASAQADVTIQMPVPPPSVDLQASPGAVGPGGFSTLSWMSSNASACSASGDWSGSRTLIGSQQVGPLTTDSTFILSCTGSGGSGMDTVQVAVNAPPPPPPGDPPPESSPPNPAPATEASGGGSSLGLAGIGLLILAGVIRRT